MPTLKSYVSQLAYNLPKQRECQPPVVDLLHPQVDQNLYLVSLFDDFIPLCKATSSGSLELGGPFFLFEFFIYLLLPFPGSIQIHTKWFMTAQVSYRIKFKSLVTPIKHSSILHIHSKIFQSKNRLLGIKGKRWKNSPKHNQMQENPESKQDAQ